MSECMKCNCIQGIPIIGGQAELLHCRSEAGGCLGECRFLLGSLKDGFTRLAAIGFQHRDHVSRNTDKDALSSLLDNVEAAGVVVHILSAQLENFRGAEAGLEREQAHVVQLMMPKFQISQQSLCLITGKKTQALVVDLCHLPDAASRGERIAAAPELGCNGVIDGGTHEAENVVNGLGSQQLAYFCVGLFGVALHGFFLLCVPGGRVQQICLEAGEQVGIQLCYGQGVDFALQMGAVLAVMLIDVLPLTSSPLNIAIYSLTDGHFSLFDGIDTRSSEGCQKFCPFISCHLGGTLRTLSTDGLPMAFSLGVRVPEGIDTICFSGTGITFGRVAEEHALKLCFYVFSASYVAHEETVASNSKESNMLIQNLSKTKIQKNIYQTNILILFYFLCVTVEACDREREREREREADEVARPRPFRLPFPPDY